MRRLREIITEVEWKRGDSRTLRKRLQDAFDKKVALNKAGLGRAGPMDANTVERLYKQHIEPRKPKKDGFRF